MSGRYWLERAWLGGDLLTPGVLVEVTDGRFAKVERGVAHPPRGATRVQGLTIPGMANAHSHAFHRALRGRTQRERGTFWSWREQMYALAARLTPDGYHALARAVFGELLAAGTTCVGEFHYLHHGPDGQNYDNPNAMGEAVMAAAREAGIRITLLDACYLTAGVGRPAEGVQRRFADADADAWVDRVAGLSVPDDGVVLGAAIHSVRAVPRAQLPIVAGWAADREAPLHTHLSEQVAENEECLAVHALTPTGVLAEAGALGPRTTLVHATHLSGADVGSLGEAGSYACFCPTTERDLGDGIGPSRALHEAGATLTLGSDSHAMADPFEEMRAVELDERLASHERGHWSATELVTAATEDGHTSLGFPDAGRIAVGARADLVTVDASSPRTAGTGATLESIVFAAGAGDVRQVVCDGRVVFAAGEGADHRDRVAADLEHTITSLWRDA